MIYTATYYTMLQILCHAICEYYIIITTICVCCISYDSVHIVYGMNNIILSLYNTL